jgi:hypothetical protein
MSQKSIERAGLLFEPMVDFEARANRVFPLHGAHFSGFRRQMARDLDARFPLRESSAWKPAFVSQRGRDREILENMPVVTSYINTLDFSQRINQTSLDKLTNNKTTINHEYLR